MLVQYFALPRELWRDCILCFVTFKDIARATEAILNRAVQRQFRQLTDGHTSSAHSCLAGNKLTDQLKWCLSRNILYGNIVNMDDLSSLPMTMYARVSEFFFCYIADRRCDEKLSSILQACARTLKCLHVHRYPFSLNALSSCVVLETLLLNECPHLTAHSLRKCISGCHQLKDITIESCKLVEQCAFSSLFDSFPRLESLRIGGTEMNPYNFDAILAACKRSTSQMKRVVLVEHTLVTGAGLSKLTQFAPCLRTLRVDCTASNLTDTNIADMSRCCAQLIELSLTQSTLLTCAALVAIAHQLPMLQNLDVAHSKRIGDSGVIAVANCCVHIKELNLSNCEAVTDLSVREIWTKCTLLEELNLFGCRKVTDAGFPALKGQEQRAVMRRLSVCRTSIIGAPFLQSRKVRCLNCNERINSTFVRNMSNFRYIEQLVLMSVQLNPDDFLLLSTYLPSVRMVYLSYSSATDAVLQSLIDHCPCLSGIVAHFCPAVTASAVERLNSLYKGKILYRA